MGNVLPEPKTLRQTDINNDSEDEDKVVFTEEKDTIPLNSSSSSSSSTIPPSIKEQIHLMKSSEDDTDPLIQLFYSRINLIYENEAKCLVPISEAIEWITNIVFKKKRGVYKCARMKRRIIRRIFRNILEQDLSSFLQYQLYQRNETEDVNSQTNLYKESFSLFLKAMSTRFKSLFKRCFWTGRMSSETPYFHTVVPLQTTVAHPINVVPVCGLFKSMFIVTRISSIDQPFVLASSDQNPGSYPLPVNVYHVKAINLISTDKQLSDLFVSDEKNGTGGKYTSISEEKQVCPRNAIRGWIARIVLFQIEMFGKQIVPFNWISDELLLDWVKLPVLAEEWAHSLFVYGITFDLNPYLSLSPTQRFEYAKAILNRLENNTTTTNGQSTTLTSYGFGTNGNVTIGTLMDEQEEDCLDATYEPSCEHWRILDRITLPYCIAIRPNCINASIIPTDYADVDEEFAESLRQFEHMKLVFTNSSITTPSSDTTTIASASDIDKKNNKKN